MSGKAFGEGRDRLLAKVRAIRTDVRALRQQLLALEKAAALQKEPQPDTSFTNEIKRCLASLQGKNLPGKVEEMRKVEDQFPQLQVYGDETGEIRNGIEEAISTWPKEDLTAVPAIQAAIKTSSSSLDEVAFACCRLTIPDDVEERLERYSIGEPFDFEAAFSEELPDKAKRGQILIELSQRQISGWVDQKAGLIYKLSPDRSIRVLTYLSPLLWIALAVGLLIGIANLKHLGVHLSKVNLDEAKPMVAAFLLVLGGAVTHLVVENVKQFQLAAVPIVAIGNLLDWMHLRWAGLSLMVLPLLVTVIGLRMLGVDSGGDQVATYVLAGYSADSVSGLFLTRFDSAATASLKSLTKKLESDAGSSEG